MHVLELAFTDDPARLEGRPAHRERLAELSARGLVLAGGPFADESGALIVFLTDRLEDAQALVDADPYYTGPGVSVVSLRAWSTVTRHPAIADL
jgi:uncharacterized protein YciI